YRARSNHVRERAALRRGRSHRRPPWHVDCTRSAHGTGMKIEDERSERMTRFTYSGCLFAVAFAASGAVLAQQVCEQDIQQLEREAQASMLDQQTELELRQLMTAARSATDQNCQQIVSEARDRLSAAQSAQGPQVAQAQPGEPSRAAPSQQPSESSLQGQTPQQQAQASEQRP